MFMTTTTTPIRFTSIVLMLLATACLPAVAQPNAAKAAERCEAAVAETIRRMRGADAQELQFAGAKRLLAPTTGDEMDVKGEGRYRSVGGAVSNFAYSCVFDSKTGATSGVMFRETGAPRAGGGEASWQPDLTRFSPDSCESAAAAALKTKYPRVGRIVFDANGRQLRPAPNARTIFEGQGAVERAIGMNAIPFKFICDFETRSGKVLSATTTE
jgi:hypothetical protein